MERRLSLFRLVLTIYGFILGALVGSSMLGASDTTLLIFGSIGGGAVGALIVFFGYFVGGARGAFVGLAVDIVWNRIAQILIRSSSFWPPWSARPRRGAAAYVIIVWTAFVGAWTMIFGGRRCSIGLKLRARVCLGRLSAGYFSGRRWTIGALAALGLIRCSFS